LGEAFLARKATNYAGKLAEAEQERIRAANEQLVGQLGGYKDAPRRIEDRAPMAGFGQPTGAPIDLPEDMRVPTDKAEKLAAAIAGMDPGTANAALSGVALQQSLATPKYERVDLGDAIGVVDEAGNIVGRIPKGATPDAQMREAGADRRWGTPSANAQLSEQGAMYRHGTPSGSARLGADVSLRGQEVTMRGQDLTAETARTKGDAAGTASPTNPMGLTGRQPSGLKMQENAVLNYAANLTGMTRAEIDQIYVAEGPAGVSRVMKEKGGRFVQGRTAMALGAIPFVGDALVNLANPDVIAPIESGAAGAAAFNNSTGPIANADVMLGRKQMPQPQYPLENQAQIVEQILSQAQKAFPNTATQPTGPLEFATEAEAEAAGIPPGTRVVIGGVPGTWQ
jgi:hypothetical protein